LNTGVRSETAGTGNGIIIHGLIPEAEPAETGVREDSRVYALLSFEIPGLVIGNS
jgi:hypothetical protein